MLATSVIIMIKLFLLNFEKTVVDFFVLFFIRESLAYDKPWNNRLFLLSIFWTRFSCCFYYKIIVSVYKLRKCSSLGAGELGLAIMSLKYFNSKNLKLFFIKLVILSLNELIFLRIMPSFIELTTKWRLKEPWFKS